MRVLKDVISGDELVSDSFPLTDQGVVFVAKGKVTTVVQKLLWDIFPLETRICVEASNVVL